MRSVLAAIAWLAIVVVISLGTSWYDVRRLTEKELRGVVDQLVRGELELVRAGRDTPH